MVLSRQLELRWRWWFPARRCRFWGGHTRSGGCAGSSSQTTGGGDDIATNEDSFGTNNQVEGVDEADLLKSNGNQAFVAYGRDIVELNIEQNEVQTRTTLPDTTTGGTTGSDFCGGGGSIDGMLLIDERLIVFAREYTYYCGGGIPETTLDEEPLTSSPTSTTSSSTSQPIVQGDSATKVLIYDTTTMELLSTEELTGSYISARSIDNNVYVVTSNWINTYPFTQKLDPYNQDIYGADFTEDQYRTMAQAEATSRAGAFVDQLVGELDCESIQPIALLQNSADALSFGGGVMESLVNVHSFSVDGDATGINLNTRSMMLPSAGWNVYASQNFLVLAGEGYNVDILPAEGEDDSGTSVGQETYVIVYELDGDSIADVKIGSVPGYTLNQFAIDQYRQVNPVSQTEVDYLRIASCTRERWWWGPEAWEATEEALCEVNVLEISDEMPIVGTAGELGHPGERIYSVRFQGDRGFVVTFRETDPFYTLDLSDPTNPQAVGELEIPGFSNYLHPVGDNSILGVGQAVEDGVTVGLQISLFDVSNFAAPERVWNYIEADGSYSDAQYDHRGFRYLQDSGILILPLTIYGDYGASNGLDGFRLYSVDLLAAPGIEPYLTIEHGAGDFYEYGCWSYTGYLASRSIVVGGSLRTFKGHTIVAYNLSDRTPIGLPINLDEGLTQEDCSPYYFGGAGADF